MALHTLKISPSGRNDKNGAFSTACVGADLCACLTAVRSAQIILRHDWNYKYRAHTQVRLYNKGKIICKGT